MRKPWVVALGAAISLVLVVGIVLIIGSWAGRRPGSPPVGAPTATSSPAVTASPSPDASLGSPSPTPTGPSTTTAPPTSAPPTTRPPSPPFPPSLAGKDIERIPTTRKVVALTFDAGSNADGLPAILATLRGQGVRATFFLTGDFVRRYPAAVASIVAAGHRVANHSATHPYFTDLTDAQIRDQLARAESAIRAAGADPRPLFRFPYGDRDSRTIRTVNGAGYVPVRWTVDTLGWKGLASISAAGVVSRALGALQPGEIVLMHVGSHPDDHSTLDADALPAMITAMKARGYGFVTLDALL
jgi:peptidoglycan-N-acetylglucosamine deacetylase